MSNQFTQCTCLYQASTHFPRVMTLHGGVAAVVCVCVNSPMVTVPSRDHTVAQVCPPCPPPALGSAKSSGRCKEAMERGFRMHWLLLAALSVSLSTPPLHLNIPLSSSIHLCKPRRAMTAPQLTRLEKKTRRAHAWQHVSLWGCFSFQKSDLKRCHESGKEGQQNSQNYFKWKDFILAQTECVMILLSSVQWTHNLSTVLSKSNFSWFLASKNLEL